MGSFADSLRQNIERVNTEVNVKINAVASYLFSQAVVRSPHVGQITMSGQGIYITGRFINNWFPAVDSYDTSTTSATSPDGAGSIARINEVVKSSKAFFMKDGFLSLSNNLDYATRVEYASVAWPKGLDPKTGWHWTGRAMVYAPVQYAMLDVKTMLQGGAR